jgi:hypothetical protein
MIRHRDASHSTGREHADTGMQEDAAVRHVVELRRPHC